MSQKWDEYTNSVGDEFIYLGTSVNLEVSDRYLQVSNYELSFFILQAHVELSFKFMI